MTSGRRAKHLAMDALCHQRRILWTNPGGPGIAPVEPAIHLIQLPAARSRASDRAAAHPRPSQYTSVVPCELLVTEAAAADLERQRWLDQAGKPN
ncbi:hypothetical protein CIB48_g7111 [Xylaria polymorpha]|nr:hypothetical protein CIB48_g7111 [Xylaria polymorpha]